MDLKALMQKLETINKTEILTESEKKETTWTDKSGKKHPATQVKGDKYTGKEADKEAKKSKKDDLEENFTGAIARGLVEEFGYDLDERITINPDGTTSGKIAPPPAAAAAPAVNNPYQGADAAKFAAMSPEDQAWLTKGGGQPDINDPYILMRAPNKGKQVTTSAYTGIGNPGEQPVQPTIAPTGGQAAQPVDTEFGDLAGAIRKNKEDDIAAAQDAEMANLGQPATAPTAVAGGEKGSKPVGPTATTQEKMDRFVFLMNKKKAAGAPAPAVPAPTAEGQMYNLLSTLSKLSESVVLEALSPEEEKELQTIAPEVVGTVDGGAEGVPPEVAKAVTVYKSSGQAAQPGAPKAAYKGSTGAQEIQKLNPTVKDVNKIQVGQKLKMPDGSEYTVKPGDTLDKIAKGTKAAPYKDPNTDKDLQQIGMPKPGAGPTKSAAAPAAGGQAAQPAGKVDLSVNNPAMNPANNAPLPVPGAAATDNQKKLDAMKAKYGTPGSTTRESVQSEDDLILARIRGVSIR